MKKRRRPQARRTIRRIRPRKWVEVLIRVPIDIDVDVDVKVNKPMKIRGSK